MALFRETPKCPHCGKVIAKARYKDQSHLPVNFQVIGDTFEGWDYEEHECDEQKEFVKSLPDIKL